MNRKPQVINDPIHNLIETSLGENNILLPFIEHPVVQRLRHIKQMGLADLVFPSALHNRFSHSIGTSCVVMKIAKHLNLPDKDIQLLALAGLLHDIGHGPFSHAFEELFFEIGGISHEEWTPYFMQEIINTDFINSYNIENPTTPLDKLDLMTVEKYINRHKNQSPSLATDLISSQLDADRLDYLLRDSHFCGVKYGHYDLDWLINCMTLFTDENGNNRLALRIKSLEAVEQYLMARRFMNNKIYWHCSTMVMEHVLVKLLILIVKKMKNGYTFSKEIASTPILKFIALLADTTTESKEKFMQASFKYYKILSDYDVYYLIRYICTNHNEFKNDPDLLSLARTLQYRNIPYCRSLKSENIVNIQNEISELITKKHVNPWEMSVFKAQNTFYSQSSEPIYISSEDKIEKLESISDVIKKISSNNRELHFLYISKDAINKEVIRKFLSNLK